jgi:opacity protein-like surface antigen
MAVIMTAGGALAADTSYLAVRAGMFLPNGAESGDYKGLKYFDTGYNVEVAAGYRPESYVALEVGTGVYGASGTVSTPEYTLDRTITGVPITLTAKGILEFEKMTLYAGAGIGYYQAFIDNKISIANNPVNETGHGAAVGYQVAFDSEFRISPSWQAGASFRWFSARPEIEMKNIKTEPTRVETTTDKWEIGGVTLGVGVKYLF